MASRKSLACKQKSADKYRAYNNERAMRLFNELEETIFRNMTNINYPYEISTVIKGRHFLAKGDYESLTQLVICAKTEEINLTIQYATEAEIDAFQECEPLADRTFQYVNCVEVSPNVYTDVCIKTAVEPACDLVTCTACEPLPPESPLEIKTPPGLCIYSGPGNGKTELISSLPIHYRGLVYDTDHYRGPVPSRSLLITNRPDVFEAYPGLKLAHLPSRSVWLQRCRSKCGERVQPSWFDDVRPFIHDCLLIRSDLYLGQLVTLRSLRQPKRVREKHSDRAQQRWPPPWPPPSVA